MQNLNKYLPFYAVFLSLTLMFSCTKNIKKDSVIVPTDSIPTPSPVATPIDIELGVENVILVPDKTATEQEVVFTMKAQFKMNEVVRSQCFSDYLLKRKMIQTQGRSNQEVIDHIRSLKGTIPVSFYSKRFTSEMAVRYPPALQININRRYFSPKSNLCEYAGTIAHESIGHSLGNYDHDFSYNKMREFSVPYSLNAAFWNCCK